MQTFVKINLNDIVYDKQEKVEGKVKFINSPSKTAKVEVITATNEKTGERTTKLIESRLFNLLVVNKAKTRPSYDPNKWWSWVRNFQVAFGQPAPLKPTMLSEERIKARNEWMHEECRELEEAKTLEDQVDAAIDKLYFALGDLVELGVKPDKLLEIVQNANMGKLWDDGKPRLRESDGKIMKPDGWEENFAPEPRLQKEIERQLNQ